MRINFKQLKKLPVETESGTGLGQIHDAVFETEGQMIVQYKVRTSMLSSKEYLISREQIVRFTGDKIIVDDNVAKRAEEMVEQKVVPKAEPVMMRENLN